MGYIVFVFSYRPYNSIPENPKMQTDAKEFDYPNIFYSQNIREATSQDEILTFIHKTAIYHMIIIETCYFKIFEIAKLCQNLGLKTIGIVNVETVRYSEFHNHDFFQCYCL